jgi:ribonucleoside-diphosphate reductase beta chain
MTKGAWLVKGKKIKPLKIFAERPTFKPFKYPRAYDLWLEHEQMHWLPREVALHEDLRDWSNKLTAEDRQFLTNVFLLFTQGDVDVANGYIEDYLPHFKHPEIRMMLLGFAAREAVHIDAYSYLNEQLGKSDSFYEEFLKIPIMAAKHEFFEKIVNSGDKKEDLPLQIAGISAFTEGMFLFSSFVMLLNYPRNGLMKGMGQIITWSILDEQKHVEGLMYLLHEIIKESPRFMTDEVKGEIYATAELMQEMELDFIDYVYGKLDIIHGLRKEDLKNYIRYIVNRRLLAMGLKPLIVNGDIDENPLPWVDEMIGSQNHENFFETRATSYAKGALRGSWGDVWGKYSGHVPEAGTA